MKICILLQRRFAFIGHNLALLLKETYGVQEFCGYVSWRPAYDFLRSQKEITYSSLLFDEDIHASYKHETLDIAYLKGMEAEIGIPNLWGIIAPDRVLMFNQLVREYPYHTPRYTYEEILRIFQVTAKAVVSFMDTERPDAVILPNGGGIGAMILFQIAKKRGIKIFHIMPGALPDRFVVSDSYFSYSGVEKIFKKTFNENKQNALYQNAKDLLEDFRKQPIAYNADLTPESQPVNRLRQMRFLLPKNLLRSAHWFGHLLREYFDGHSRYDYTYTHPWYYLVDHTKRKINNAIGVNDLYDPFDINTPYVFFGLHYEPEVSILLQAPFMTDQINIIRQMARSLPVGYYLYVKDHPLMAQFRPRSYYKELKKIPNVRLMDAKLRSFDIIKHARLVSTITGSVIWEGLLLGKPAISFGHQFYNVLSMVKYVHEIEQLPYLVKQQLENFQYNEEELLHYIAAILADSAVLKFYYLWEKETDEVKKKNGLLPLVEIIAKKLDLKVHNTSAVDKNKRLPKSLFR
ncbi:MAG: hypothetical protein UX10_C0006G0019 [Candidatus Magasanikbacteria bacterium GW2011_GWA2_45_39]|uniref:Capsule polysaccharide biosynthesis protein n=1 Tax=Candidatus Magasanikbacteria bacterium GW2011_GWA2_45_39 TaxID=1619041 RepID=A0A0G1PQN0_9BACT|nr:MAG: hypothetical protein UX10_C0006G0019 [Candidatus Magasanikbacteria bacterium GW2011_GWA2_45_39]